MGRVGLRKCEGLLSQAPLPSPARPYCLNILSIREPTMRALAPTFLLAILTISCVPSAIATDSKADPSQYTLAVHVSAAAYESVGNTSVQMLTATIGGKHYQLAGPTSKGVHFDGLIDPGDYRARLSKDQHNTSYESIQEFELQFPDGTTRNFKVIAQSE